MKLEELSLGAVRKKAARGDLGFRIGPFDIAVQSSLPGVAENIRTLYGGYPLLPSTRIVDFNVEMRAPNPIRRYYRPQVNFYFDGFTPFKPLPQDQAFAMFEWGLNWCIASNAHQYLIVHSAVVAKEGKACILPGSPGSGKSTLCAGMVNRGWRLLSDEMCLIDMKSGLVIPVPRPVSLKNQSIDIVRAYAPDAVIGEIVHDTAKGTVGHMRPTQESLAASQEPAVATLVVFPKYTAGSDTVLQPFSSGRACLETAENSFNYHILGADAFNKLTDVVGECASYSLQYQNMDAAIAVLDELIAR